MRTILSIILISGLIPSTPLNAKEVKTKILQDSIAVTTNGSTIFYLINLYKASPGERVVEVESNDFGMVVTTRGKDAAVSIDSEFFNKSTDEDRLFSLHHGCMNVQMLIPRFSRQSVRGYNSRTPRACKRSVFSHKFISISFSNKQENGYSQFYFGEGESAAEAKNQSNQICITKHQLCKEVFNSSPDIDTTKIMK